VPRPTSRGYALLTLAVGTYLVARVVGTWELYLSAFAFVAVLVVAWVFVAVSGRRVEVEREVAPQPLVAGDEPEMIIRIKNRALLPGPQLTLRNRLVGLAAEDLETEAGSLGPRSHATLSGRIGQVSRGMYILPPAQSVAEDPLGVARAMHPVSEPLSVMVYPRLVLLDSCAIYPDMGLKHDWSGTRGLLTPGASEFRGIRPHQPGEPLSHIDWKTTAKTGVLMLREMEEPAGNEVTILLDGTADAVNGNGPDTNYELAVRATGSVADFALRAGRSVNLLRHEHIWHHTRLTPDGNGRRRLLESLAEAQADASAPLLNALRHLHTGESLPLRAQTVTVVCLSLSRQLVRALVTLHDDGVRVSVLYAPGHSFSRSESYGALLPFLPPHDDPHLEKSEGPSPYPGETRDPASATLSNQDKALLSALAAAGIPSITLEPGDDLTRTLTLWQTTRRHRSSDGQART
jgi:uncharacterized protein (DUF58 family)